MPSNRRIGCDWDSPKCELAGRTAKPVKLAPCKSAAARVKPSSYYERLVDVMEELYKFTFMTRDRADYLVDRYSERKAEAARHSVRNASNRLYTKYLLG